MRIWVPAAEQEDWDKTGCSNKQEWRDYLNQQLWKDHTPDMKDDCYIGTAPERISWKRRHEYE